jgi:general secretion pathway protein D
LTGVLTDEQFRIVLRALEQRSGVDILAAPRVTTLSGRQAQIQVAELKSVLTGVEPAALRSGGATPTTNSSPFTASQVPIGPTLDIIPVVAADGRSLHGVVTGAEEVFDAQVLLDPLEEQLDSPA